MCGENAQTQTIETQVHQNASYYPGHGQHQTYGPTGQSRQQQSYQPIEDLSLPGQQDVQLDIKEVEFSGKMKKFTLRLWPSVISTVGSTVAGGAIGLAAVGVTAASGGLGALAGCAIGAVGLGLYAAYQSRDCAKRDYDIKITDVGDSFKCVLFSKRTGIFSQDNNAVGTLIGLKSNDDGEIEFYFDETRTANRKLEIATICYAEGYNKEDNATLDEFLCYITTIKERQAQERAKLEQPVDGLQTPLLTGDDDFDDESINLPTLTIPNGKLFSNCMVKETHREAVRERTPFGYMYPTVRSRRLAQRPIERLMDTIEEQTN